MNAIKQRQVALNVVIHDRVARRYEAIHGEIFNTMEQDRLRAALGAARDLVRTELAEVSAGLQALQSYAYFQMPPPTCHRTGAQKQLNNPGLAARRSAQHRRATSKNGPARR